MMGWSRTLESEMSARRMYLRIGLRCSMRSGPSLSTGYTSGNPSRCHKPTPVVDPMLFASEALAKRAVVCWGTLLTGCNNVAHCQSRYRSGRAGQRAEALCLIARRLPRGQKSSG